MKSLGFGLLLTGMVAMAGDGPSLQWDFSRGFKDVCRQQPLEAFDETGKVVALPPVVTEGKIAAVKLDGKTLLRAVSRETGSMTVRVMVKFAAVPQGALISRNRPEDGMRGIECGLVKDKAYVFDGPRPAATVSGGDRATIKTLCDSTAPALRAGIWYDLLLRFESGKYLAVDISEPVGRRLVYSGRTECTDVKALSERAGEKLLCFGGRRANSKRGEYLLPAGTLLANPMVWTRALSDAEVSALTGVKPASAATGATVPQTYYVDGKTGNDGNDGLSVAAAFSTIQRAAELVNPGDTVVVQPGIYFEQVNFNRGGRVGLPVTFKAADGGFGKVVVTSADPAIRQGKVKWQLEDAKLGLYSIPLDHNPARVLYSGTDLFPYPTLDGLKQFMLLNGYPGIEHGFHYADGEHKLYVRLHAGGKYGSTDPNRHVVAVAPINAEGSNGTQIWRPRESNFFIGVRAPAHIVIDGFTLETPGAAGVVTCGGNVVVRNCWFKGCRLGVFGSGKDNLKPESVFIENCHYDQAYTFSDMIEVIGKWRTTNIAEKHRFFWWQRKGLNNDSRRFKNYETGLPGGVGRNWHIRDNVIEEAFEGMSSWAIDRSENVQVYGNRFRRLVDNVVEAENHNRNMRVCFNRIEDVFEPFSWQPLGGMPWPGPVFIYRNIVTVSPELKDLWPTHVPGIFKIGASGRNWEHQAMGGVPVEQLASRISKRFVAVPDPGFLAFNNTLIFPYGRVLTTPMPIEGRARRELVNFRFFNNIFNADGFHSKPEWDGSLLEFYANIFVDGNPTDPRRDLVCGENGLLLKDLAAVKFRDVAARDFQLRPDSPALKRGTTAMGEIDASADLGAIPSGTVWQLAAGPGQGIAENRLSAFQRAVRYNSELVRTAGPVPGIWGVYAPETPAAIRLDSPAKVRSVVLVFRLTGEKRQAELLRVPGSFSLTLVETPDKSRLEWYFGSGAAGVKFTADLPPASPSCWQQLRFTCAAGEKSAVTWNGKLLKQANSTVVPAGFPAGKLEVMIGRNPIADVQVSAE